MAKLKNEMQKLHRRKIKKAKEQLDALAKGKKQHKKLNSKCKKVFCKRLKAGLRLPAGYKKTADKKKTSGEVA